jgi:hypothetical protein
LSKKKDEMRKKILILTAVVATMILLGGLVGIRHQGSYWCRYCCTTAKGSQWLIGFQPDNKYPITKMKYTIDSNQKYLLAQPDHHHEWIISQGNENNMGGLVVISRIRGPAPCDSREMLNHRVVR